MAEHRAVFYDTARALAENRRSHLNILLEPAALQLWAERLGFEPPRITRFGEPGAAGSLVQSVAVLAKPLA